MKSVVLIPARLASSRFPRKALADIHGKPTVQRVYEGCLGADGIDEVYVATPDKEIADVVESFGGQAIITGPHETIIGRCAEAVGSLRQVDAVVIVGGDEPMITPHAIELALSGLPNGHGASVLVTEIKSDPERRNPNTIKVLINHHGYIMYITRAAVPAQYKQSDIIALGRRSLDVFCNSPQPEIERVERVDTVRFLYYGQPFKAVVSPYVMQALDTEEDLEKIRGLWDEDSRSRI